MSNPFAKRSGGKRAGSGRKPGRKGATLSGAYVLPGTATALALLKAQHGTLGKAIDAAVAHYTATNPAPYGSTWDTPSSVPSVIPPVGANTEDEK